MSKPHYAPVWQTWVMMDSSAADHKTPDVEGRSLRPVQHMLREQVQMARIQRRWSIGDLAREVGCPAQTLIDFERGDEILSRDLQVKLCNLMGLKG